MAERATTTSSAGGETADWTRPVVEQVADGVHRIPLPLPMDGLRAVNVYALVDADGIVLVDAGWRIDPGREALRAALAGFGAGFTDVRTCLVTHVHRDHYTLARDLRAEGAQIGVGEGERANLAEMERIADGSERPSWTRLLRAGAAELVDRLHRLPHEPIDLADWAPPDRWLQDGETVTTPNRGLRVLATPGHTAGHVVYVDDVAGLMFSGDHVLPHITPSIGLQPAPVDSPLAQYLDSLAAVLREPDRVMLPAHGPAGGTVHLRVDQLLEHHRVRLNQTLTAIRSAPGPAYPVAQILRWTRHERHFAELDVFNQMLAVGETLAHLVVLEAQGRVEVTTEDEVLLFRAR